MSKKTKSSSSYYGGYSGGSKYWENWEKQFSSYSSVFASREKRMKIRNSFESISKELYIPTEVRFSALPSQSSIRKSVRVNIDLDERQVEAIKSKKQVREILEASERLPENATFVDNTLFSIGMLAKRQFPFKFKGGDIERCAAAIRKYYLTGEGDINVMRTWLEKNAETEKEELKLNKKSESSCYGRWNGETYMSETPKELVSFLEKAIRSKFFFPDTISKEENYRKGNRISRGFMSGTSYKPLIGKTAIAHKKKKVMIVIDGSGSMGYSGKGEFEKQRVMNISSAFAAGMINSGLFDISHCIIHHDAGWKNFAEEFRKGKVRACNAGGEGFQNIDETIPEDFPRQADYVLFLTDMNIGSSSQQGMASFLKRAKKHMILSFESGGTLQGLNVRKIDSFSGMTNALATLLA